MSLHISSTTVPYLHTTVQNLIQMIICTST